MRSLAANLFMLATVVAMFGFGRTATRLAKLLFFVLFLLSLPVRVILFANRAFSAVAPRRTPRFRPAPARIAVA